MRFAEKKGGGVLHVLARRGGGGFRKEEIFQRALPSDHRRGRMGHEILVSLFFLFFFPSFFFVAAFRFLWSRERNFNCAVVCLVMRIRAPFFHLVPREIADVGEGGMVKNLVEFLVPLHPSLACEFARPAKRKFSPSPPPPFVPHLFRVDSTLLGLSPTVVSRAGGFVSLSVHTGRKWTSGSFLATMNSRSIRIYICCVYILTLLV